MIINELRLNNFGIYAGDQKISFKDTSEKRPIILFGGYNGRGKTTIFEAILLGLYGNKSFAFLESKLSYSAYLNKFVNKNAGNDAACVELSIHVEYESEVSEFVIRRTWSDKGKYTKDDLIVRRNGQYNSFFSDNWDNIIDSIMPNGIAKLFLFDGEKIGELLEDADDKKLQDSIKMLLGIDIIEKLSDDLKNIISRNKLSQTLEEQNSELKDERLRRDSLNQQLSDLVKKKGELSLQIAQEQNKLKEAEAKFSKKGGKMLEKQETVTEEKDEIDKSIKEVLSAIYDKAAGYFPLLLVKPLLDQIATSVRAENDLQMAEYEFEGVRKFLGSFGNVEGRLLQAMQTKQVEIMTRREQMGENGLGMSPVGAEQAETLSGLDVQGEFDEIARLMAQKNELQDRSTLADAYLDFNIDKGAIQKIIDQIKNHHIKIAKLQVELETVENSIADINRKFQESERVLQKIMETLLENEKAQDSSVRLVKYSTMARAVLREYQHELQAMKIDNLSELATEKFKRIIGKKTLVERLIFDKETLSLTMFDKNGKEILRKQLSAGERQLLSTAIVWALGESTGQQFPMIIDTPLARLDTIHRDLFIKNYIPQAAKQTIILSTDAELVGELLNDLEPFIVRKYLLSFNEESDSTTVVDGYFKEGAV